MLAAERGSQTTAEEGAYDGRELALDLVHLTRQCQGDPELEDSLLRLFRRQARMLTAELPNLHSIEAKIDFVRRVRGSALSVGARRVAAAAALVEESARDGCAGDLSPAIARAIGELEKALEEAVLEIDRLCR